MITYHGGPITPDVVAACFWEGRHALISFAAPDQLSLAAAVADSFVLDNGAFSFWKKKKPTDWPAYYQWVSEWKQHPGFDWAVIPDTIDGSEKDNDALIEQWPYSTSVGVPVFHLHEDLGRLRALATSFPRVALGSSGKWATPGTNAWWERMGQVMAACCDGGKPITKLHGLRMLRRQILGRIPFASADSSTVARNIGLDVNWKGYTAPRNKRARAFCLGSNLERVSHSAVWVGAPDWISELAAFHEETQAASLDSGAFGE